RSAAARYLLIAVCGVLLVPSWMPLGRGHGVAKNGAFVGIALLGIFGVLHLFSRLFPRLLAAVLARRLQFALSLVVLVALGAWVGTGFGREFMPPFDEGAFLFMPSMPEHGGITQSLHMLHEVDAAIESVPEVRRVVGKLGRADSALDPAPVSMLESIV